MEPTFSRAWFETFGRRDDAETAREVDFLLGVLPSPPASVLDVPCGFGRHARALAERGYAVTGIEREPAVAAEARAGGVEVHELDMRRLDELPGTFDAVICLWASFGWWDDDTNAEVLRAMAAKTRTTLVLDVYDPAFFRAHQGPRENRSVRERRRMDGNRLRTALEYRDGTRDEFEWRLYEPEELAALGTAGGLRLDVLCAGYDPQAPPPGDVPRMQAVFARDNRSMADDARERYDDICDALTAWHDDVRRSVIFGMPCLKKSGRVIAGFRGSSGAMVFKLTDPEAHARALALPGAHLFHPGGGTTVFKQWVVVPPDQADEWEALAMDALRGQAPLWENHDPASSSR